MGSRNRRGHTHRPFRENSSLEPYFPSRISIKEDDRCFVQYRPIFTFWRIIATYLSPRLNRNTPYDVLPVTSTPERSQQRRVWEGEVDGLVGDGRRTEYSEPLITVFYWLLFSMTFELIVLNFKDSKDSNKKFLSCKNDNTHVRTHTTRRSFEWF